MKTKFPFKSKNAFNEHLFISKITVIDHYFDIKLLKHSLYRELNKCQWTEISKTHIINTAIKIPLT